MVLVLVAGTGRVTKGSHSCTARYSPWPPTAEVKAAPRRADLQRFGGERGQRQRRTNQPGEPSRSVRAARAVASISLPPPDRPPCAPSQTARRSGRPGLWSPPPTVLRSEWPGSRTRSRARTVRAGLRSLGRVQCSLQISRWTFEVHKPRHAVRSQRAVSGSIDNYRATSLRLCD